MRSRALLPGIFLLIVVFLSPPTTLAQPEDMGPPGLFKRGGANGPEAMTAVGQKRLETLRADSTTQSIRLVRIAGNLSQRRRLIMHVGRIALSPPMYIPYFRASIRVAAVRRRSNQVVGGARKRRNSSSDGTELMSFPRTPLPGTAQCRSGGATRRRWAT